MKSEEEHCMSNGNVDVAMSQYDDDVVVRDLWRSFSKASWNDHTKLNLKDVTFMWGWCSQALFEWGKDKLSRDTMIECHKLLL